jgi:hypothetical protein
MIEAPAHDALALRLVLREPAADACAAAFVSGLSWPAGTAVRLEDGRPALRPRADGAVEELPARLARAGVRISEDTQAGQGGARRSDDLVGARRADPHPDQWNAVDNESDLEPDCET